MSADHILTECKECASDLTMSATVPALRILRPTRRAIVRRIRLCEDVGDRVDRRYQPSGSPVIVNLRSELMSKLMSAGLGVPPASADLYSRNDSLAVLPGAFLNRVSGVRVSPGSPPILI